MKLRLVRFMQSVLDSDRSGYYEEHRGKVYVFMGEYAHAPGHCMLVEFGSKWKIYPAMCHIDELEFLDGHPDDVRIEL